MRTIGSVLDGYGGIGHGFDFLRLFLSLSVVLWHAVAIVYGDDSRWHDTALWIYKFSVLPMFFALSGFLITGSALRLRLRDFLVNRGLRIVPALAVEILLSAFILGPLFTTVPLGDYFTDRQFFAYFLNIVGWFHFDLPGVFRDHPRTEVNGVLWTIPYEIGCYAILSLMIALGLLRQPAVILLLILAYFLGNAVYVHADLAPHLPFPLDRAAGFAFKANPNNLSGPSLTPFFLAGCLAYLLRHRIPYSPAAGGAALLLIAGMALVGNRSWELQPLFQTAACVVFVYLVVFVGVSQVPMPAVLKRNDISYGIYLYGWPIQQTVIALYPGVPGPIGHVLVTLPFLMIFASLSWRLIERPILRMRRHLSFLGRRVEEATEKAVPTLARTA